MKPMLYLTSDIKNKNIIGIDNIWVASLSIIPNTFLKLSENTHFTSSEN